MKSRITHILVGMLIASAVGMPSYLENVDLFAGIWSAVLSTTICAGCKEFCDNNTDGNKWDWGDFLATCLGGLLIVLIMLGFHYGKG